VSSVADLDESSARMGGEAGRANAGAGDRPDEPPAGLKSSQGDNGSELEADTAALRVRGRQGRRLTRGCWLCGRLGHDLKDCWIADYLVGSGQWTWAGLRGKYDPRRSGER